MFKKVNKDNYPYDEYCSLIYKRKRRSVFFKALILLLIWTPLVVYYFLPISKANIYVINGNALNFSKEYIYEYTNLNPKTHLWNVNTNKMELSLNTHPYCSNANVYLTFNGLKIDITEVKVVAKSNESDPSYYLSNGHIKIHSAIKDLLKDPLSDESKFINPYIDKIPTIDKNEFSNDEFYEVVNRLGTLESSFVEKIKSVKKNNDSTKFLMVTLVLDSSKLDVNKDVNLNLDYRDIDNLINNNVIDTIINKINNGEDKYYNVLIENDIQNKGIKIVPYNE